MASSRTDTCGCLPRGWSTEPFSVRTSSDRNGGFLFEGMTPGWVRVAAYAPDHAPRVNDVLLRRGERATCDLVLERGASVRGIARGPNGAPVPDVRVEITEHGSMVANPRAVTGADGSYRLRDVTPGRVLIAVVSNAGGPREYPWMAESAVLEATAGEELAWSPTLRPKGSIRGRLVDEAGAPLAGWPVSVRPSGGERSPTTDREGRFTISGCGDRSYTLSVPSSFGPRRRKRMDRPLLSPEEAARGWRLTVTPAEVEPAAEEVTFVVVRERVAVGLGVVAGVLVDPEGTPLGERSVRVARGAGLAAMTDAVTGRFEIDGIGPGAHELEWEAPSSSGRPLRDSLRGFEIAEGEFLDLGEVAVPAFGHLALRIDTPPGLRLRSLRIELRGEDAPDDVRWRADLNRERRVDLDLPKGAYLLSFDGPGVADEWTPLDIEAGEVTALHVSLGCGTRVRLRPSDVEGESLLFEVRDQRGDLVMRERVGAGGLTCGGTHEFSLGPGRFAVEVNTDTGRRGTARFEVLPDQPLAEEIEIVLHDDPTAD